MNKILIFGATSKIAIETAKKFALDTSEFFLTGRDQAKLNILRDDLKARGSHEVHTATLDILDTQDFTAVIEEAWKNMGEVDIVLIALGTLPDQEKIREDYEAIERELRINFLNIVHLMTLIEKRFKQQKKGCFAVISSVAGDRGRQSNYIYGTAKGALSLYLQGLRNRLVKDNIHVLTIKPGFVDTPMTKDVKKGLLFASAESVGESIYQAILKKRNQIYTPFFWRYIMLIIKSIPEFVFKKLKL